MKKRLLTFLMLCALQMISVAFAKESPLIESIMDSEGASQSRPPLGLTVDRHFSPIVGADGFITLIRGYSMLDDKLPPSTLGDTSAPMMAGRFGKLLFVDYLLVSNTAMIAQHEIFGHGFRAREFNLSVHRYKVTPFRGYISYNAHQYAALSPHEKAAFDVGGMEGTRLMGNRLSDRWMDSQSIDVREASLYLSATLDQTLYVLGTKKKYDHHYANGHDVMSYLQNVNQWHKRTALTERKLKRAAFIDFLNPHLFYSLYTCGQYVADGSQIWEYPMLDIGEYRYLPQFRSVLAPFGPEYQMTNWVKGIDHNFQADLRFGSTEGKRSAAIGLLATQLLTSDLLNIDGRADIWHQPKLFTASAAASKQQLGAALSVLARYRILQPLEITGQLGYKTTGYMPGEALKHSPILRVGFGGYF